MKCARCGHECRDESRFCDKCGEPLLAENHCPRCGMDVVDGARFCSGCGMRLGAEKQQSKHEYEKDIERRFITVMFCDLANSTMLSEAMDPEEFRELIQEVQGQCAESVKKYDGWIGKFLGDGLLIYFGYPKAHVDDPARAVYSGLEMIRSVQSMLTAKVSRYHVESGLRIGIHSGLVVAGELEGGEWSEQKAIIGKTPNMAARLQAVARLNSVVVSNETRELVQHLFDLESLGYHELKGIEKKAEVFLVKGVRNIHGLDGKRRVAPFINRKNEMALIEQSMAHTVHGRSQCMVIAGDAGIGKSRLIEECIRKIFNNRLRTILIQGNEFATHTPYYPMKEFIHAWLDLPHDAPHADIIQGIADLLTRNEAGKGALPLFLDIMGVPREESPLDLEMAAKKKKSFSMP
ncbi:MAG: zinc-ribbon domain-containing protein [Gammaproteobacteria bacterium]|nr:MAG: zinc-ribbon domain-containing protein [Gammaproteobacteria bacterium]